MKAISFSVGLCFLACAPRSPVGVPHPSAVPSRFPDPLLTQSGQVITSVEEWRGKQRPRLHEFFSQWVYGPVPPALPVQVTMDAEYDDFQKGQGILRLFTVSTGPAPAPKIQVMVVLPKQAAGPLPVILAINFCGNHALTGDRRIPFPVGNMHFKCTGVEEFRATEKSRDAGLEDWPRHVYPMETILARGYALASFWNGDVDPDQTEIDTGLFAYLAKTENAAMTPTQRRARDGGSLTAWAWGFHRVVDALLTFSWVDPKRIAILGHSRNGKAALWAGATDERVALVLAHQSGIGGAAPNRGSVGESVENVTFKYPYWFSPRYRSFAGNPHTMEFDQNALIALYAPRPVLFSNGRDDFNINPEGQWEILLATDAVYRMHGVTGVGDHRRPVLGATIGDRLGYFLREGKHSMTALDWKAFLDFADRHLRRSPR